MKYMTNTIAEAINNIEDIKKGYITGFFDAEGNIDIKDDYTLSVLINQAHKQVLESINILFSMPSGIQIHSKEGYDKKGVHRKGAWRWRLFSDDAIPFLKYIQTYSIEKKQQIELALKYQEEITSHKNSRSGNMFRLSQTEIEQREWFKKQINDLKYIEPDAQSLKNYDNEIKLSRIPKDIREGKQMSLIPLEELYKIHGIDTTKPSEQKQNNTIPIMSNYIETGYLSGFFDGEGYIGISKGKRSDYALHVTIVNTNFDMLKLYEKKFGGKIRHVEKDEEHYKEKYHWDITNFNALPFLKYIQNWTVVKRKQVDLAIEFQEWHNIIKIIKTPDQKQKAEWYYNIIKELKKETGELTDTTNTGYNEEQIEQTRKEERTIPLDKLMSIDINT